MCLVSLNNAGKNSLLVNHEWRIIFQGRSAVNQGDTLPGARGVRGGGGGGAGSVLVVINALFHLYTASYSL